MDDLATAVWEGGRPGRACRLGNLSRLRRAGRWLLVTFGAGKNPKRQKDH